MVAVLLLGLRDNSRVKEEISNSRLSVEQTLLAIIADNLQFISWTKTKDAKHGKYNQKSILKTLNGDYEKKKDELISFKSPEEYEEYMKQFNR